MTVEPPYNLKKALKRVIITGNIFKIAIEGFDRSYRHVN